MIDVSKVKAAPGVALYECIKSEFNFAPVLRTAIEECGIDSIDDAADSLDAFIQWIAALPAREEGSIYVMLKSDVDRIFHAFVLNTRLYREFCETYLGHFVDHTPFEGPISKRWVDYTINLLDGLYGTRLHPALSYWKELSEKEAYKVSCGNC
jgi:hypothetical protein